MKNVSQMGNGPLSYGTYIFRNVQPICDEDHIIFVAITSTCLNMKTNI